MGEVGRQAARAGLRAARRAGALTVSACLLVACSSQDAQDRTTAPDRSAAPRRTADATPAPQRQASDPPRSAAPPAGDEGGGAVATVPARHDAATLAAQLDHAATTLRDRQAAETDVRRAGEFQQLAVHTLSTGPDGYLRRVLARLRPETAMVTRNAVHAVRLLRMLTDPAPKLPQWRILAPAPPKELQRYYHQAQRRTGVPWTYLAAVNLVESRMGRIRGASTAGALGPMQFLPSTWDVYGAGGDVNDPHDAILAAGRLLRDNGAPGDMANALYHYNPAASYVRAVTAFARTIQRSPSAYRGYWHWRVLFRQRRGTYVLPVGYPDARPVPLRRELARSRR
jgi:membrane-bound lytic murein transglycosylase B